MTTVNWSDNPEARMITLLRGGYKLREVVADLVDNSIDYGGENCTVHEKNGEKRFSFQQEIIQVYLVHNLSHWKPIRRLVGS